MTFDIGRRTIEISRMSILDKPWVALFATVLAVGLSSLVRLSVFGEFGRGIPYLTYYGVKNG